MKELISKQKFLKEKKIIGKSAAASFEWLLSRAFIAAFITLLASQSLLFYNSVKSTAAEKYNIAGEPLGYEAYLFKNCKMELKLTNIESCPDLKVLVNGEERGSFKGRTVLLDLKDGDVIELDANLILVSVNVQVNAVSKNIGSLLGKSVTVTDGIVLIANVNTTP